MPFKHALDIIIVTYNAKDKLKACLRSIKKHSSHLQYTLTVIDNHSTDGTGALLKESFKGINYTRLPENKGFSHGANLALRQTHHEYIALLDDDIEVPAGWVEGLYSQMQEQDKAGIVGPKLVLPNGRIFAADCSIKRGSPRGAEEWDKGQRDYIRECDAVTGPCWLMRRAVFNEVGNFDEDFFPCQGEDSDYCLRARLKGYKIIYNGAVSVIHYNLFRTRGLAQANTDLLKRKWAKVLAKLPFKDASLSEIAIEAGFAALERGCYVEARESFLHAQKRCPGLVNPYVLGVVFFKTKSLTQAKLAFERALQLYPSAHPFFAGSVFFLALIAMKNLGSSGAMMKKYVAVAKERRVWRV